MFQQPHLPQRTEHGGHQLGELHVLAQIGRIGRGRQADPLDVEPPGHVEPPARHALPSTGVQKAQSKVSLAVNDSGLLVSAPRHTCSTLCRCRSDSRISPWLGRKSLPMASRWSQCRIRTGGRWGEWKGLSMAGEADQLRRCGGT